MVWGAGGVGEGAEGRLRERRACPLSFPRGKQTAVAGAPGFQPEGRAHPPAWKSNLKTGIGWGLWGRRAQG